VAAINTFQLPQPGQRNADEIRESCDFANVMAVHRARVAEAERTKKPIKGIKAADAAKYGIPF